MMTVLFIIVPPSAVLHSYVMSYKEIKEPTVVSIFALPSPFAFYLSDRKTTLGVCLFSRFSTSPTKETKDRMSSFFCCGQGKITAKKKKTRKKQKIQYKNKSSYCAGVQAKAGNDAKLSSDYVERIKRCLND